MKCSSDNQGLGTVVVVLYETTLKISVANPTKSSTTYARPHIPHILTAFRHPPLSPPLSSSSDPSLALLLRFERLQAEAKLEILQFVLTLRH